MFHTLYNVATLMLLIPFVSLLAKLMQIIIPRRQEEASQRHERSLMYLDANTLQVPTLAVVNAQLEICRMWKIANENLSLALESFFEKNTIKADKVLENEKTVDFLHQNITAKLVDINNMQLSDNDAKKVGDMFVIVSNIEQIGDRAENIAEYAILITENTMMFSDTAMEELQDISKATAELMLKAYAAYEKQDKSQITQIMELESDVDRMAAEFARNHFRRLKQKLCKAKSGVVFMDMINDLEKSADNAEKIAISIQMPGRGMQG